MVMKIAFFVHGYLPWDAYGVPRYVERLGSYLAQRHHQIYVIVVGRPNLPKIEKVTANLTIYRTKHVELPLQKLNPYWSLASYTLGSLIEASKLVKEEDIQLLHGHTIQWGGLQSALVSKITHKPFIITLHGSALQQYSEKKLPQSLGFLRLAKMIICQKTSAAKKLLLWDLPEQKIMLLPQGCVDTERFRPATNRPSRKAFVVTFVGRLVPFKGPALLLQAAPYVLSKFPNTVFQFIGEGKLKDYLIDMAKSMCIADKVKFLGFRHDVNDLLRRSDVFVSLSPYENVSDLSLLEAMATGVPVVATDTGETRRVVKDKETGLLARNDPKDVARKILTLFNNKSLSKTLSENERHFVVERHCVSISAKKMEEIYWSVISNGKF
jgi:glycosyltransferase involved in cell wall biosynthesis